MRLTLFATGFLVSVLGVLPARYWLKKLPGEGWVYLAAISLRLIALLIGCLAIYVLAKAERSQCITAYASGVAVGWVAHVVYALWVLKK